MDGNVSTLFFSFCQETFGDVVWWRGTVNELEVKMFNSLVNELFAIISWLVESYNKSYPEFLEYGDVIVGCEGAISIGDI